MHHAFRQINFSGDILYTVSPSLHHNTPSTAGGFRGGRALPPFLLPLRHDSPLSPSWAKRACETRPPLFHLPPLFVRKCTQPWLTNVSLPTDLTFLALSGDFADNPLVIFSLRLWLWRLPNPDLRFRVPIRPKLGWGPWITRDDVPPIAVVGLTTPCPKVPYGTLR